ncbi:MAG: PD-(D/E)XK nuclease family protein, partial [Nitrosomonas sp.]|nr:PD-(D/E)XK nuclease family protein [Nitrosomonas sp.]
MSAPPQFLQIPLADVLKRLAAAQGAGMTVVTPNRRLASALKRQFNEYQAARNVVVWASADIIPFSVFVERLYQDALYSVADIEFPVLLSSAQAQVLWESIINDSDQGKALLAISPTAKLAYEAWQLAHVWQLLPELSQFPLNEDSHVFNGWVQSYQKINQQNKQIDGACLCDWLSSLYEQLSVKKPATLVCYGFEIFTPQQESFLNVLLASNCDVRYTQPNVHSKAANYSLKRVSYINLQEEIYQAAVWARSIVESDATVQIGVVVPTLSNCRDAVIRIFTGVMSPDIEAALPGSVKPVLPFNVSLGKGLASYPLIYALFQILALLGREVEYERVSQLLRSPFFAGGESEMRERALLDVQLRKKAEPVVTINRLIALIKCVNGGACCSILTQKLSELADFRRVALSRVQKPSAMAKTITEILNIAGFPGDRPLDSTEYQAAQKWHEVLANFSTFDHVVSTISYSKAISRLNSLASETLFQPETPDVPIQILGVMEAAGMEFDHLWVMGLSDDVWPMHPRPNPFLPIGLQRQAKLPLGSSAEALSYSRQLTAGWLSCANEVVLSHPERSNDRDGHVLKPSALIKQIPVGELKLPAYENYLEQIQRASQSESIADSKAPGLEKAATLNGGVNGGVSVIKDFAACPFRAMAKHRLGVESLVVPHVGLNALERGMLIHDVLAKIWQQLKTKSALDDASDDKLEAIAIKAAEQAICYLLKDRSSIHSLR